MLYLLKDAPRKYSNIAIFLKLSPLLDYTLLMSEMLKNGVTEFVSEIWYLKEGAYLDKFDFVTRYDLCCFWQQNILDEF